MTDAAERGVARLLAVGATRVAALAAVTTLRLAIATGILTPLARTAALTAPTATATLLITIPNVYFFIPIVCDCAIVIVAVAVVIIIHKWNRFNPDRVSVAIQRGLHFLFLRKNFISIHR